MHHRGKKQVLVVAGVPVHVVGSDEAVSAALLEKLVRETKRKLQSYKAG